MSSEIATVSSKMASMKSTLDKFFPQIKAALPLSVRPERFLRVVLSTIQKNPALLDCTQISVLSAIIQASQLGLDLDAVVGHAYLIPYKDQCQLIVGYKGMIQMVRNHGELRSIYAEVVHSKDRFTYCFGLQPNCIHEPSLDEDPGAVTHVYAVAVMKDGAAQFSVMKLKDIEAIRSRSRAGKFGPWVTDFEEMAKKTVLRRLCKLLPMSVEAAKAIANDERIDADLEQIIDADFSFEDEPRTEPRGKLDMLLQSTEVKQ